MSSEHRKKTWGGRGKNTLSNSCAKYFSLMILDVSQANNRQMREYYSSGSQRHKFIASFMSGPYHDLTKQFGHFWQDVRLCILLGHWSVDLIVLQLDADNNMLDVTFISSSSLSNHPTLHSLNIRASKFGPLLKFSTGGSYLRQDPSQASDWSIMTGLWLANMRHQCFLGRNVDRFVTGIY